MMEHHALMTDEEEGHSSSVVEPMFQTNQEMKKEMKNV